MIYYFVDDGDTFCGNCYYADDCFGISKDVDHIKSDEMVEILKGFFPDSTVEFLYCKDNDAVNDFLVDRHVKLLNVESLNGDIMLRGWCYSVGSAKWVGPWQDEETAKERYLEKFGVKNG